MRHIQTGAAAARSVPSVDLGLQGRTVLVTGGYRGTGQGMCRVLAAEGATVSCTASRPGRPTPPRRRVGGRAVHGDIRTDAGADAVADAVGDVDVLVNNYGVAEGGGWFDDDTDVAGWIDMYERTCCRACAWSAGSCPPCGPGATAGSCSCRPSAPTGPASDSRTTTRRSRRCCR